MTPAYRSLLEVSELIRARQVSAVDLTTSMLERIERLNPEYGAYYAVFHDQALAAANAADKEIAAGGWRGPLHGIPVAFKDLYEAGPTTAGSPLLAENVAHREAALVVSARKAGAVVLGKLATHEFGLAAASLADRFPPARNVWDPERTPGGSSTGAGTAIAGGMAFGAFGTDTGGSVRLPAAFSGVVGFKPTFGRLSMEGVIPLSPTLDHAGALARTVSDVAALCDVSLAGGDASRVRVGVPRDFWEAAPAPIRERVDGAIEALAANGAQVQDVRLGVSVVEVMATGYLVTLPEATAHHLSTLRRRPHGYGHEFGLVLRSGLMLPAHAYVQALRARARIARRVSELLHDHDVLAMPTVGVVADPLPPGPRHLTRRFSETPAPQYTWLANLYGGPAVSVPCGLVDGLPVGLQLMGRSSDDATVLDAARTYESARGPFPLPQL